MLKNIRYFGSFGDDTLNELEKICSIKKLVEGEILFYEGDEPENIYFLNKGYLNILKNNGNLKQTYIHTIGPGNLVAEVTIFEKIKYPATTEAVRECEILVINKQEFMNKFFNDVHLIQEIVKSLSMKVKYLMNSLESETSINVNFKIAKFIIKNEVNIKNIKHKDIAYELNTTSETVSRILKKFKEQKFLSSTNPIIIQNIQGIRILCN